MIDPREKEPNGELRESQGLRTTFQNENSKEGDEDAKAWLGINAKHTNFFGLLQLIDEVTMIRFMGRDLTIFLKYLRF